MGSNNNSCRNAQLRQPGVLPIPTHILDEAQIALAQGRTEDAARILQSGTSGLGERLTPQARQQLLTLSGGTIS